MLLALSSRESLTRSDPSDTNRPHSSIVGRPRHQGVMVGMGQKDSYVGYDMSPLGCDHSLLFILVMKPNLSVVS